MLENYDNLTLEIQDYKITNIDNVITSINNETNFHLLKNYYDVLKNHPEYHKYENINMILFALEAKLKALEMVDNNPLNDLLNIYVTLEEIYPLIKIYTNFKVLSENDYLKIYAYLSNALSILQNGFTLESSFEQELVDFLLNHISNKERNKYEEALFQKYNNYLKSNNNSSKAIENGKKKTYGIPGIKSPLLLGDDGASLIITVITITILIGMIIAAFLLVK